MKYVRWVLAGLIVTLIIGAYVSGVLEYVTLNHFKQCAHVFSNYTKLHCMQSIVIFCVVCFFSLVLSFPWAALFSIAAGYLFGLMSLLFVVPTFTLAAAGAFLIARYVLGTYVQEHWGVYLRVFNTEMERYGGWYLLVVRILPIFPYFLINSVAALTPISLRAFCAATFFGIIPPTALFVFAGTKLAFITSISDIISWPVLGVFILLAIVLVIPMLYQRFFAR